MCDGGGLSPPSPPSPLSPLCGAGRSCSAVRRSVHSVCVHTSYCTVPFYSLPEPERRTDEGGGVAATALIAKRASERASEQAVECVNLNRS